MKYTGATSAKATPEKAKNSKPTLTASYRSLPICIMGGLLFSVNRVLLSTADRIRMIHKEGGD